MIDRTTILVGGHSKPQPSKEKGDPSVPASPRPERIPEELEPVLITPGGRFWAITLPPDLEEALRVSRF